MWYNTYMKKIKLNGTIGCEINSVDIDNLLAEANGEDIEVSLNSGGGSVYDGFEIYSSFANYKGHKTLILGSLVASAATYMICAFDEVKAQDISAVMIHDVSTYMEGSSEDMKKEAENMEKMQNQIANLMSKKMQLTPEAVNDLMHAETWYMGQEIVDAHLADSFIDNGKSNSFPLSYYKNQVKKYENRVVKEEKKDMTKEELLKEAEKLGLNLVDKKDNKVNELSSKVTNLEKDLANAKKVNEQLKLSNELDTIFGVKDDKNLPRNLAETLAQTGMAIKDMKENPIMKNLMAEKAAGIITGKEEKKNEIKDQVEFDPKDYE